MTRQTALAAATMTTRTMTAEQAAWVRAVAWRNTTAVQPDRGNPGHRAESAEAIGVGEGDRSNPSLAGPLSWVVGWPVESAVGRVRRWARGRRRYAVACGAH